ncbi:hypothetical protein DERP_007492 [Dermatophagoides pteronyssinus]|uniref:Uncharacterized protein n=1 Tax=Dermatophagoides pteronyssinus TaxID=6956 RepID=A0ABQ8J4J2_DERPT|nr:hypothetical protein DERP_007492 [Dermatophagoides pteronyssinus]
MYIRVVSSSSSLRARRHYHHHWSLRTLRSFGYIIKHCRQVKIFFSNEDTPINKAHERIKAGQCCGQEK